MRFHRTAVATLAFWTACNLSNAAEDHPVVITLKTHIKPHSQGGVRYNYIPFHVPEGATRLDVWNSYDKAGGKNVVDLGIFDSRAVDVTRSLLGYRGKSPQSTNGAFLSAPAAAYGYTRGPIPSGRWQIYLDAYKVSDSGADVTVTVVISTGGANTAIPTPVQHSQVARESSGWFKGDLHMHTLHSDGHISVPAMAGVAENRGLDFICMTDHNTASHHADIARLNTGSKLLVIPGEEITTDGGHIGACGLPLGAILEFRIAAHDSPRLAQVVSEGHSLNALLTINHPFADCQACDWSFGENRGRLDAIEVWNSNWDETDERAVKWWDTQLRQGYRTPALAASDTHDAQPGEPTTVVWAKDLSQPEILRGIRGGHVYMMSRPNTGQLEFTAQVDPKRPRAIPGDQVTFDHAADVHFSVQCSLRSSASGAVAKLIGSDRDVINLPISPRGEIHWDGAVACHRTSYFRIEIRDAQGSMLILSNPIFIKVSL